MQKRYWAGIGTKFGGMIPIGGGECFVGVVVGVSEDNKHLSRYVQLDALRCGTGLGGSIGISMFFSNATCLDAMDGKQEGFKLPNGLSTLKDYNLNIQFANLKVPITKQLLPFARLIAKSGGVPIAIARYFSDISNLRDITSTVMNVIYGLQDNKNSDEDIAVVIDVPNASIGIELSAFSTVSTLTIRQLPNKGTGTYIVRVPDKGWRWHFYLYPDGTAKWQDDEDSRQFGGGRWHLCGNHAIIRWYGDSQGWDCVSTGFTTKSPTQGISKMEGKEWTSVVYHNAGLP